MALQIWLPLNGTLENKGLSNLSFSNTATSAITVDNNGKIGKCYRRATNNSAGKITSNLTINLNGDLSIFCWAKVTSCPGDSANGLVSNHSHVNNTGFGITVKQVSTSDFRISCSTGNGSSRTFMTYYGTSNIKDKWCHLGLTYDNTKHEFKLWVNGVCEYTQSYTNASRNDYITIFDWSTTYDSGYKPACYLNDVRVYNHCLSPKEVKEISKGLILHYKLDGNDIGITIPRNGGLIPDGVELYDYILSDGNAYIDTNISYDSTKSTYKVETKFSLPANVGLYDAVFGAYTDENSKTLRIIRGNNNSIMWSYYNTKAGGGVCGRIETANSNIRKVVLTSTETIVTENGTTTTYTHPAVNGNNTTSKFYLFCQGTSNGLITCKSKSRIYYFRLYDSNVIIGNFIPCTYLGEPGMWDTVENKFYRNQGTGLFTLGNKITLKEYEYLLNDANSYIDTKYIPNTHTHIKTKVQFSTIGSGKFFVYGGADTTYNNKAFELYDWDSKLLFNYGNLTNAELVPTINTWLEIEHNRNQVNCNGLSKTITANTFTSPKTMCLYAINRTSGVTKSPNAHKIQYFKIWDNDILARDLIPVSYNGTPGLWDKVEWKFYANAGSGSFTLGPEKTVQQDAPIFYDSSGYCNHGSITGTLTTNNDSPRYTKSTVFNGSSAINAGHTVKVTDAITISYWAKTSSNGRVISCTEAGGFQSGADGNFYLYSNNTYGTVPNIGAWSNNAWHHIVNTFDGRYKKIYKDGTLAATLDLGAKYAIQYNASAPIWIGAESLASNTPLTPYFNGSISDVRIYATALSADDIKELYNTSAFVTNNGIFAEYELYEDNLSYVKKRGLLETANFYENGAESGYALDTDKTRVASNYIISEDFIEI